jgi:GNAT superfamily N-acetyltransferase
MDNLEIRKAEVKDVPIILYLIKELAKYEKLEDEVKATEERLKETLFGSNAYAEVILAYYNGKIAGQALFFHNYSTFLAQPGVYLEDLFVLPELRGKGIGKELLLYLIELAKERKCGRVEWVVLNWNSPAIEFYKKMNATPLDEWTIFRLPEDKF